MSPWHMTCRLVNVSYRYLTELCFHKNCQLVVIITHVWDVTILLCFCGAVGGSTLFKLGNPCMMELLRCLNICVDMGVPSFGCAVRFNPCYKNFISDLRSCENYPSYSWLIVALLPHHLVKIYKQSHWKPIL
jgi:hypothetical protein